MASLRDLIENQHSRTPTALVYVAGVQRQVRNASGAISLNGSFGQPISGGSIQLVNVPDSQAPQHKDPVVLRLGYNGQTVPVLTGFVTSIARAAYPRGYTITVSDVLWIADFGLAPETDITIPNFSTGLPNNVSAHEVIQRLLFEWAGIPQEYLYIPQLYTDDAGTNDWMLGQLTPIAFGNSSPLQAALDVATPLGYWLFCDGAGVVRLVNIGGAPTGQGYRLLQEGVDFLVKGPPALASDSSQIFTRVVVTGADTGFEGTTLKDSWQVESPFLPGGKYRETSYGNALLEYLNPDDVTANGTPAGLSAITSVAKRLLAEKSRAPRAITVQIKGDPRLQVGMTIALKSPRLGIKAATTFFIYALSTSFGGGDYTQTLTLDGGTGEGGYSTIPPPTAAFTWAVHIEFMEAGEQIEVFVDGSASLSLGGGEIIAWHWDAPGATPAAGDGAQFMFIYPAGTTVATITLTVTDTNGKINSITNTIDLTDTATRKPTRRELNFAAGAAWYITPDGGETWRVEATGTASAVPPIGAEGSILADQETAEALGLLATGQGTKALRATADALATPSTQLGGVTSASGPIVFIWQHEKDALRIWVAAGPAVYLSVDGGTTFGPARTPPVPAGDTDKLVRWVVESQDQIGVIDVLAGRHAFTSYDSGIHWEERLEVESVAVMRCYASGHARHWVGCTGMPAEAIPLRTLEGDTAAFIDGTGPISPPTDIRALTLMVTTPVLYAIDGTGKIWSGDASSGQDMTLVATMPPPRSGGTTPVVANMMVRDGDYPVIYIAADDGLYKFWPGPNTVGLMKLVTVAAGQQGRFVGYGQIAGRIVQPISVEVVIPSFAQGGEIWYYAPQNATADHWVAFSAANGLPAGATRWSGVEVNPYNPDVWVAWPELNADTASWTSVYYTVNRGATWSQLVIPEPGPLPAEYGTWKGISTFSIAWAQDGTTVLVICTAVETQPLNIPWIWGGTLSGGLVPHPFLAFNPDGPNNNSNSTPAFIDGKNQGVFFASNGTSGGAPPMYGGVITIPAFSALSFGQVTYNQYIGPFFAGSTAEPTIVMALGADGLYSSANVSDAGSFPFHGAGSPTIPNPAGDTITNPVMLADGSIFVWLSGTQQFGRIASPTDHTFTPETTALGVVPAGVFVDAQTHQALLVRSVHAPTPSTPDKASWIYDGARWALLQGPASLPDEGSLVGHGAIIVRGGTTP